MVGDSRSPSEQCNLVVLEAVVPVEIIVSVGQNGADGNKQTGTSTAAPQTPQGNAGGSGGPNGNAYGGQGGGGAGGAGDGAPGQVGGDGGIGKVVGCLVHLGQLVHLPDVGLLAVVVVLLERIVVTTETPNPNGSVEVPVVVEEAIVIH